MEKVKSMLHSGSKKHDEVPSGSGQSVDPLQSGNNPDTVSGQGSHFGSSRTAGNAAIPSDPSSTNATSSGYGSSATGTHGLSEPYSSRMPGGFDDDAATTASVKSGIPGSSQSSEPYMDTNKALPREPASAGTGFTGSSNPTTSGTGSGLTGTSLPDRSVGSSRYGDPTSESSTMDTGRSFPLGGSTNPDPDDQYAGQSGTHGGVGTTTTPHSSNLANKADPRVNTGSAGYGSGTGPTPSSANQGSLGRDSSLGASTGYGAESWEHEHGRHGHTYGGDPCQDQPSVPGPHMVPGPHVTDTANRLDPHVSGSSGSGFTGSSAGTTGASGVSSTSGLGHDNSTAPYSGSSGATTGGPSATGLGQTSGSALGSSSSPNYDSPAATSSSHRHHDDRDIASVGAAGTAGLGTYEGDRRHERGQAPADSGSTGPAPTTAGPHKSDMLNRLDPRVDSDLSKQQGTSGGLSSSSTESRLGSSTAQESDPYSTSTTGHDQDLPSTGRSDPYASSTTGRDHHYGRDAALAGTGGAAAYEAEKGHESHKPTGASSGFGATSNPYSSNVDLRVDSRVDPRGDSGRGMTGAGTYSAVPEHSHTHGHHAQDQQIGENDHHGRDAAVAGTGGVGAYEAEKHLGSHGTSAQDPNRTLGHHAQDQQTGGNHHYGRDAAVAGTGGVGAYEAEKHFGSHGTSAQDRLAGSGHEPSGMDTTSTAPQDRLAGSGHPGAFAGQRDNVQDPYENTGHSSHKGRDAALVGAGAGALAGHEYSDKEAEKLQKQHTKEEKALEKEHSKELKHHDKMLAKEEKQHEKALEKDEKKHEKAMAAEEKKHDKHDGEKKHGGLMGLLHRDKPDKTLKEEEAQRQASHETGAYRAGDEGLSSGRGALPQSMEHDGRAYGGADAQQHGSQSGVYDSPISSGPTTHDAYGTTEGPNKLHKDPPRGYQS